MSFFIKIFKSYAEFWKNQGIYIVKIKKGDEKINEY